MRLAIHAPNLGLSLPDQPFGKDVANRGLYTALASHGGFDQISFRTVDPPPLPCLQQQFGPAPGSARLSVTSLMQTDSAAKAGTLLVVSPISPNLPGSGAIAMAIRPTACGISTRWLLQGARTDW